VIRDNKFPTTWCRQFTEFARVPPGEQGSSFGRETWPWPCNEAERRMLPPRDGRNRSTTSQPESPDHLIVAAGDVTCVVERGLL
jgi:hypothetical protein